MLGLAAEPDYGVDAPAVMRNFFIIGTACLLLALFGPRSLTLGKVTFILHSMFYGLAAVLLAEGFFFLLYVKFGKFKHRDFILAQHLWRGDEQVLDVGTGRGLLLVGAAKRLAQGHATGLDIWSTVDMGGNSPEATQHNLDLENVSARCTLVSQSAAEMPFADASFDVIVSNLCIHNIYDRPTRMAALHHIARVLKPDGIALISDYKLTGEYANEFRSLGLQVTKKYGSFLSTFPPLRVVIAQNRYSSAAKSPASNAA